MKFRTLVKKAAKATKELREIQWKIANQVNKVLKKVGIPAHALVEGNDVVIKGEDLDPNGVALWKYFFFEVERSSEGYFLLKGGDFKVPPALGEKFRELLFTPCSPSVIISIGETQERR